MTLQTASRLVALPRIDWCVKASLVVLASAALIARVRNALANVWITIAAVYRCSPSLDVLAQVVQIPADERETVSRLAASIFPPHISDYDRARTISWIANLPIPSRARICSNIGPMMISVVYGYYGYHIIFSALTQVPEGAREDFFNAVRILTGEEKDPRHLYLSIISLIGLPAADRRAFAESLRLLFNTGMTTAQKNDILTAVFYIPADNRNDVVQRACRLMPSALPRDEQYPGYLFTMTFYFDLQRPSDLIDYILPLLRPEVSIRNRVNLLTVICSIPEERRIDTLRKATLLIRPNMACDSQAIRNLLFEISRIPPQDTDEIIECAHRLTTERTGIAELARIITCVNTVQGNNRIDAIDHAIPLFGGNMSFQDKFLLICLITDIPQVDRRRVIDHALQLHVDEPIIPRIEIAIQEMFPNQFHNRLVRPEINVHAGNRDQLTQAAIMKLISVQGPKTEGEIEAAYHAFFAYAKACNIDPKKKTKAFLALVAKIRKKEQFGPLIDPANRFSMLGLVISGKEIIARMQLFASAQEDENEAKNIRDGMVSALADSYDGKARVCNQGKVQRLVVSALQGRLKGVNIDGVPIGGPDEPPAPHRVSVDEAMRIFFDYYHENRRIDKRAELIAAANTFINQHHLSEIRDAFLAEIVVFANLQEMD